MASSAPVERRGLWKREGDRVYLCGTLGTAFDRWQRARAAVSAAEAYESQRLGLVEVERLMDDLEAEARAVVEASGRERLRPRRSPGYGEMPLAFSREILEKLDATRRIGVALTDSLALVPTKSVTAVCEIERPQ
ncbi:MAG: vitamin B12 dependent-methionine synthase activation domain-containing protein [Verrucomicrobiota bacterium]|nr:vitamin B12 dependent-methionine synthase activation domain-containing protein [Verrucomicrobiota bacterium]